MLLYISKAVTCYLGHDGCDSKDTWKKSRNLLRNGRHTPDCIINNRSLLPIIVLLIKTMLYRPRWGRERLQARTQYHLTSRIVVAIFLIPHWTFVHKNTMRLPYCRREKRAFVFLSFFYSRCKRREAGGRAWHRQIRERWIPHQQIRTARSCAAQMKATARSFPTMFSKIESISCQTCAAAIFSTSIAIYIYAKSTHSLIGVKQVK